MRARTLLLATVFLAPLAAAGQTLDDPANDQRTFLFVPFALNQEIGDQCSDASTDITGLAVVDLGDRATLRLTPAASFSALPVCNGQTVPSAVNVDHGLLLTGRMASGFDVSLGVNPYGWWGTVCVAWMPDESCLTVPVTFAIDGGSYTWTFPLGGAADPGCECPAFDHRGEGFTLSAESWSAFPAGILGVGATTNTVFVRDATALLDANL